LPASQPRKQRRARASLLIITAVLLLATAGLAGAEVVDGGRASEQLGAPIGTPALVHVDGDHVVFEVGGDPVDGKASATGSGGGTYHDGFATYGDAKLLRHYEIRMVWSAGIEQLRPFVAETVAEVTAASGQSLEIRPGQVERMGPGRGQIDIVVSDSSPCTGMWLGCGGPTLDDGVVVSGQIWISPRAFERSTAELDNTVRHEFGHTMGLAHYEYVHEDRVQTMHPTRFDAARYEAGDIDGLRFTAGKPPVPDEPEPVPSGDPVGLVESAVAGPFGIVVRGWAVDPDTTEPLRVTVTVDGRPYDVRADQAASDATRNGHGFSLVRLARSGTHEVCAVAHNVGSGADAHLGCQELTVSASSVRVVGLQTL
jgi:hypothetical protein